MYSKLQFFVRYESFSWHRFLKWNLDKNLGNFFSKKRRRKSSFYFYFFPRHFTAILVSPIKLWARKTTINNFILHFMSYKVNSFTCCLTIKLLIEMILCTLYNRCHVRWSIYNQNLGIQVVFLFHSFLDLTVWIK